MEKSSGARSTAAAKCRSAASVSPCRCSQAASRARRARPAGPRRRRRRASPAPRRCAPTPQRVVVLLRVDLRELDELVVARRDGRRLHDLALLVQEAAMHRILVALTIAVFLIPAGGLAETRPLSHSYGNTHTTIRASTGNHARSGQCGIRSVCGFAAGLASAADTRAPLARRHPVLFGALVGVGVGLGIEAAVIPWSERRRTP